MTVTHREDEGRERNTTETRGVDTEVRRLIREVYPLKPLTLADKTRRIKETSINRYQGRPDHAQQLSYKGIDFKSQNIERGSSRRKSY